MTIQETNPDVSPALTRFPDPNIVLLKLVKDAWGQRNPSEAFFPQKLTRLRLVGNKGWYDGGETPFLAVWDIDDDIGRTGIGSSKRYHHSKHKIWVWAHDPEERWQIKIELLRILQKYATKPQDNIERIDIYKTQNWNQETPEAVGVVYRMWADVTVIWVV